MHDSTLFAVLAVISMLCAIVMLMFALRLNQLWQEQYNAMLHLAERINESLIVMNEKWSKLFSQVKEKMNEEYQQNSQDDSI